MAQTVEFAIRPDRRGAMSEGGTGRSGAGHGHWRPVTPVSAMVVGRLILGVPGVIGMTVIVCVWSALTGTGLGFGRAALFSLVAVTVRERHYVNAAKASPIHKRSQRFAPIESLEQREYYRLII